MEVLAMVARSCPHGADLVCTATDTGPDPAINAETTKARDIGKEPRRFRPPGSPPGEPSRVPPCGGGLLVHDRDHHHRRKALGGGGLAENTANQHARSNSVALPPAVALFSPFSFSPSFASCV